MSVVRLKKNVESRINNRLPWIYSNEIDTALTPLKSFLPGQEVVVELAAGRTLGKAYINPHSLIALRVFSADPKATLNSNFFVERLLKAESYRTQFFSKPFYRLIYGEADGLPGLIIDRFGQHFVCQLNTAGMNQCAQVIGQALTQAFPDLQSVLCRNDTSARVLEGLSKTIEPLVGEPPQQVLVEENEVQFHAPIWEGQKTGWFYDHRNNRARLKSYVEGKRVLDVFSYLGAFGIQAAANGAKQVLCIDSSAKAVAAIKQNAELNHLKNVATVNEDAFTALKTLQQEHQTFDVIILDPPAFVKKQKDKEAGLIAYQRINALAFKLLNDDGILLSCSCSRPITESDFAEMVKRAALQAKVKACILEAGHQAQDHPILVNLTEMNYLKALFIRKLKDGIV
ncbi:MAG: class I SAM-dependent rRNA methyltransferase [Gammaproteobacteria bacterium]|nr:class I SAM-dependent rRNA methyltransferase [Gammaproteobacteria bacterium]